MARWKVIHGDCREVLARDNRMYDLVFADPPFNIGHPYKGFHDKIPEDDYKKFTIEWVSKCWDRCGGVLCLHGPDELCKQYLWIEEAMLIKRIAWINWHYRFGQCGRSNWIDSRCHCLIYAKNPKRWTWNPEEVLVDSDRATTYDDPRINDTERGGKRLPFTVWGVPSDGPGWGRVTGNAKERRPGHPNQLPEKYLERIIRAYSNPGDYVLDPFGGSGTTATVAVALGRNAVTIDVSEENCVSIRERIRGGAVRVER